ncbi:hypothetical protein RND71_015571 [Anisodus tanguticus]|uniref:Cardiolipin synthase n=1 Tax=Anisodus tanguticus TaxID=243964 RepID=A0AAE1S5W7_9SOLA|nr:hypothetical protein RND71_015571 [Anisodus tanguticus]
MLRLSQKSSNNTSGKPLWSSRRRFRSQHDSDTTLATPRYSASALDLDKVACLFEDQETKLSPRNIPQPEVERLVSGVWQPPQYCRAPASQYSLSTIPLTPVRSAIKLQFPYKLCFQSTHRLQNETNYEKQWKESRLAGEVRDSFVNLPNLISLSRMISGPFIAWMIIHDMYLPAFVGLAVSGATDWLDGYVARRMGINSVVGSYLDPLADKVLIAFVTLAMVDNGLLHPGLVSLVVLRDVALVGGAVYKRASILEWKWSNWYEFFNLDGARPQKVEPLMISKVNTVLQLALVAAALLQPDLGNEETQTYITYLSWLVAMTTVGSTAAYGAQHLRSGATLKHRRY